MLSFPPKRILVALDLSEESSRVWEEALGWATLFSADIEAVHVLPTPLPAEVAPYYWDARVSAQYKRDVAKRIRLKTRAEVVHVLDGDPAAGIVSLAKARRAHLIVMGTHGRTGWRRLLLGSVAESVVRASPVPVLVLREKTPRIRSVMAPVNFTYYSDIGFAFAARVAVALEARLTAAHATLEPEPCRDPEFRMRNLIRLLPRRALEACRPGARVLTGRAADEIVKAAKDYDLVVLVAHQKHGLGEAVLGTTAERVLRLAQVPVLTVPAAALTGRTTTSELGAELRAMGKNCGER